MSTEIQDKYNSRLPEPVGPIRRMLLFSSSTKSSSTASDLSLTESPADLTFQVIVIDVRNEYHHARGHDHSEANKQSNKQNIGLAIQWRYRPPRKEGQ